VKEGIGVLSKMRGRGGRIVVIVLGLVVIAALVVSTLAAQFRQ
jgi:hypothetical protein